MAVLLNGASRIFRAKSFAPQRGRLVQSRFRQVRASGGTLVPIKLDEVVPTSATIASLDYLPTFNIFLYAKRQHSRAVGGVGVVRGIREFSAFAVSEQVAGPDGRLSTNTGLVSLRPDDRVKQRRTAASQTILTR